MEPFLSTSQPSQLIETKIFFVRMVYFLRYYSDPDLILYIGHGGTDYIICTFIFTISNKSHS